MSSGRQGETAFVTEPSYIALIRRQDIIKNLGHRTPPNLIDCLTARRANARQAPLSPLHLLYSSAEIR